MPTCPYCDQTVAEFALACHACDGDLRPLALLGEWPDAQYNAAIAAARAGDWPRAVTLLGSVLAQRPGDVDGWSLLATVHARRGDLAMARDCWALARLLRPDDPRARRGLHALAELGRAAAAAPS